MIKVNIAKSYFQEKNDKFDLDAALLLSGQFAGVCYDPEGFNHIKDEDKSKTLKRIELTKGNGHHSVYDHVHISLNITDMPKILVMTLNNEKVYTTSEKSLRYTKFTEGESSLITKREIDLYNKWLEIFKNKITERYKDIFTPRKIRTLAQENARAIVTVFMPTTLIYTVSLRQINYIASWLKKYITSHNPDNSFEKKLADSMQEFLDELTRLNLLDDDLMKNEKNRGFSLFGTNLKNKKEYFGDVYATTYQITFAGLAQALRHRTIDYKLELLPEAKFFVPPILKDNQELVDEWLKDIESVKDVYPIGELVTVYERGLYENFVLKCKERLCSDAQLEVMLCTKQTLDKYYSALKNSDIELAKDLEKYTHGARCTFPNFKCNKNCGFKEGINLNRDI